MLYRKNKTMELLGNQFYMQTIKGEAADAFNDMLNAYRANGCVHYADIAMDAFMLGYIYGKRAERAKKKRECQKGRI